MFHKRDYAPHEFTQSIRVVFKLGSENVVSTE